MSRLSIIGKHNFSKGRVLVVVLAVGGSLFWGKFKLDELRKNSLRAEAKLMLAYIQTLQNAHHTDEGHYSVFNQEYGASIGGSVNCTRPEGAKNLGFILRNCERGIDDGGPRYSYRVKSGESNQGFVAYATSGNGQSGSNLVCTSSTKQDIWRVQKSGRPIHVLNCE